MQVNGLNTLEQTQRLPGSRELAKCARKNQTTPRARGSGQNPPYDPQGAQEWAECTRTTPRVHGNRSNAHERTRPHPGRTGMDRTQPIAHGNGPNPPELTQRSLGMERSLRSPVRIRKCCRHPMIPITSRAHWNRPNAPYDERKWTERTL